jgi:hypothetical protein
MAKADTRPEAPPKAERKARSDTVKPPESLPDASPFERMTELMRRLVNVSPKELARAKRENTKKRRH